MGRRPRAGLPVRRPPALPVVHPERADQGGVGVRHGRRRLERLRRIVARGRRRRLRREPGAALDRRPGRAAGRRRRRVRPGRHGRQPVGARRRPSAAAAAPRGTRPARWVGLRHRRDPFVGQALAAGRHGRRHRRRPGRRARPDDRRRAARRPSTRCPRPNATGSSPSSSPPARPTSASSTTSPAAARSRARTAGGCTSTAPTAAPGWPPRPSAPLFAGIEQADSFIVDPHKWLFAPYDCCALIYRDPELGRAAHTQHADYLDPLDGRRAAGTRPTTRSS